jgi:ribosomal protein S18 acetylase RimI-like enzyme
VTHDLRSASSLSLGELAELFTRAYADYVVPFSMSEEQLRSMAAQCDLDLDGSSVAYVDGEPAGLCNLAVRGDRGWIFGVGVVPQCRRRGLAETLLDAAHAAARERGVREMTLEVIAGNTAAHALYEKAGYRLVRDLEVWTLEAQAGERHEVPWRDAHAVVRAARTAPEPWQRADETFAGLDGLVGLRTGSGAAVVRVADGRASLLQLTDADAAALVAAARTLGQARGLNLPAGGSAAEAFAAAGGTLHVRQHELALTL